jgi:hypothetical protein
MGQHKIKKLLHNKGNIHQIEKAAQRMGEKSLPAVYLTGN